MHVCLALLLSFTNAAPAALSTAANTASLQGTPGAATAIRLKTNPVLGKLVYVENNDHAPIVYLFARPGANYGKGFEKTIAEQHAPWLQSIEQTFRAEYVDKLGLVRRADAPPPTVVVLWTAQDYEPYVKTVTEPNGFTVTAHYDAALGAVITYEYSGPAMNPMWRRWPELAQLVRAEMHAYAASADARLPYFLVEGLSAYLANHEGHDVSAFRNKRIDKTTVDKLVRVAHDAGARTVALPPLPELFESASFAELRAGRIKKYGIAAEKVVKTKDAQELALGQAWSLVHYLVEGEKGKYRAHFEQYVKAALQGDPSFAAFRAAFKGVDLGALEVDYYKWMFSEFKFHFPNLEVDEKALKDVGVAPKGAKGGKGGAPATDVSAFADFDAPAAFGACVAVIRSGRLASGIEKLEKLRSTPKIGEYAAIVDRELVRCRKFTALRDKHLAALAASGGKFVFERDGKKITTKIRSIVDGKVHLEENRAKVEFLTLDELDPLELAKAMDKSVQDGPDGWARWYPLALAGDAKAMKQLKGDGEAASLREDADKLYPNALKIGAAIELMERIAVIGAPTGKESAQQLVDVLTQLARDYGELEVVKSRAPAMAAFAATAYQHLFEPAKIAEVSSGKVEMLADGRVRFTYAFDKKEELGDFTADHGYFQRFRGSLAGRAVAATPEGTVSDGALRVRGAACFRSAWTFTDGVSVRYDLALEETPAEEKRAATFAVAVCDDTKENFVWCQGFGSLYANDARTKFVKTDSLTEGLAITAGVAEALELNVADGLAVSKHSGQQVKKLEGVPHRGGGVFLFVHSDPIVRFEKIVIEGKPQLAALEQAWIAKKVAELAR